MPTQQPEASERELAMRFSPCEPPPMPGPRRRFHAPLVSGLASPGIVGVIEVGYLAVKPLGATLLTRDGPSTWPWMLSPHTATTSPTAQRHHVRTGRLLSA